ncbi:E3 binding domain-containing protein [Haloarchaeobius amylolyticus]|uniref:E3 binding domain-containing protein n=1 Tax=Haloarchaeobius amylolyticus TaxID=1198296 RepID=UPI00226E532E|nr:E3 binding domain-containing protein [Haloarchaeobius amylolyticus]
MAIIVKMPKLGLEMEQGTVLEWFVDPGQPVSEGDVIAEVESEKSIGEVEAREDGELRRIYLEEGESIPPGKPIGILANGDADIADLEAEVESELGGAADTGQESSSDEAATGETGTASGDSGTAQTATAGAAPDGASAAVKASPRAKKRAEELSVDLSTVEGTGPMDSVTEADVEAAAESGTTAESDSAAEEVKASPRAKKRAEELGVDLTTVEGTGPMDSVTEDDVEAAAEAGSGAEPVAAQRVDTGGVATSRFQQVTEVAAPDAGEALLETTEAVRAAFEDRVTTTDLLLVVASAALADTPVVNGTYGESTHQVVADHDIALVTEADGELTTGVIPAVDEKSLTQLVEAREGLVGDEDERPSFTLAEPAGDDAEGLLVNRPAVAALEVDLSGQRAVPGDDGVDLRPLVTATLTYDTRAIGRSEATAFLDSFFERAAESSTLVLDSYRGTE